MSAAPVLVSIGDDGVLNKELSQTLSEVWLDRDLGWLDFNDRVLAQALDERTRSWSAPGFWRSSPQTWTIST